MGTNLATLRRTLAQRMNFWGGNIQTGLAALTSATSGNNTLIDTTRTEPDDEWNSSWIVLNPGSSDQVNLPTIWRRVSDTGGWVQNTGTFTIFGSWPAPYASGVSSGVSYEVYKTFRPEQWLQGINYALVEAYPHRHRAVSFDIPQSSSSRIIDYGFLGKAITAISNPASAPTVTEIADGTGAFQPGAYTFSYTLFNDFGESIASPTTTITIAGTNSRVQFASITSVPASAWGANYYSSVQPGDAVVDMLNVNNSVIPSPPTFNIPGNTVYQPGMNVSGTISAIQFQTPNPWFGVAAPQYNTTTIDFFRLHRIMQRLNPGAFPELWNDLDPSYYRRIGGNKIMLMYLPTNQFTLKLLMTTQVPTLLSETDITQEPAEMVYWGAEAYLWDLITKISQILNSAWEKLGQTATNRYEALKNEYKMDLPRDSKYVPIIKVQY